MKKKLEAELISIAHRVLKDHNRGNIAQLQKEALNLYEKLSVLRFYEEHFEPAKPTTISRIELETAIEKSEFQIPETNNLNTTTTTTLNETEKIEPIFTEEVIAEKSTEVIEEVTTEINEIIEQDNIEKTNPILELEQPLVTENISVEIEIEQVQEEDIVEEEETSIEISVIEEVISEEAPVFIAENIVIEIENVTEKEEEKANPLFADEQPTLVEKFKTIQQEPTLFTENLFTETENGFAATTDSIQTSFANLFGQDYKDLEFIKAEDNTESNSEKTKAKQNKKTKQTSEIDEHDIFGAKLVSDLYTNTINLGLNDRIAFQLHLFNDSDQDLNRVISQLNTMNNLNEALDFIAEMVKPDYNNWKNKEEYEDRFMALVTKRFS